MYLSRGFSSSCSPRDWSLWQAWPCPFILPELHKHSRFPTLLLQTHAYIHTSSTPQHTCSKCTLAPMHGRGVGGVHRSLTAVTPARQVAREMPHHLKRLAVARRAPLKRPKTAEEGDGAHNVICLKWTNKRKSSHLERLLQRDALGTLASQNCRDRGSSV